MAFSGLLFIKAIEEGMQALAADATLWSTLFPNWVDESLRAAWHNVFAPGGKSSVVVIPAYRPGMHRPPCVVVRVGAKKDDGTPLGFDSIIEDADDEQDTWSILREEQLLAITAISQTPEMTAALVAAVHAAVLTNIRNGFFHGQGVTGVRPEGETELEPNDQMPNELLGTFLTQTHWHVREENAYRQLVPIAATWGDVGVAEAGNVDHNLAPGRVRVDTDPPEPTGFWPLDGAVDVNAGTYAEARFSRRMDATTTLAAVTVTEDDVVVESGLTISLLDDPATNLDPLRGNRLRVVKTGGWTPGAVVAVSVGVSALSDFAIPLENAAAWTFSVAG